MEHLNGMHNWYTTERITEDMKLRDNELFRGMDGLDVLDVVKKTLRVLEEDAESLFAALW